ncbi:hypothetical protein ACFSR7_36080 [Cohnella sp. GCM10020058]|uniref:hypothetical protein n=1 Tax=Cohnella sp. GCM10020058 TaxID=3317330 RepID=UPI003637C220
MDKGEYYGLSVAGDVSAKGEPLEAYIRRIVREELAAHEERLHSPDKIMREVIIEVNRTARKDRKPNLQV